MDTIANMLSQLKNASLVNKESLELKHSKACEAILKVMEATGFIKKVSVFKEKDSVRKSLHVELAYDSEKRPMLRDVRRVSKPGRRLYAQSKEIKRVNPKSGLIVISTPQGVMSGQQARKVKLGGEVICEVR